MCKIVLSAGLPFKISKSRLAYKAKSVKHPLYLSLEHKELQRESEWELRQL